MVELTLEEKVKLLKAQTNINNLVNHDRLWTDYLITRSTIPPSDMPHLVQIAKTMHEELLDLETSIQDIQDIVKQHPEKLQNALQEFDSFAKDVLADEQRKRFHQILYKAGGIDDFAMKATSSVLRSLEAERSLLLKKISTIQDGKFVQGDIEDRCGILAASITACLKAGDYWGAAGAAWAHFKSC